MPASVTADEDELEWLGWVNNTMHFAFLSTWRVDFIISVVASEILVGIRMLLFSFFGPSFHHNSSRNLVPISGLLVLEKKDEQGVASLKIGNRIE